MNILIAYNNDTQLAQWVNKNYDPEDEYAFLDIEHKEDALGCYYDRVVLLGIVVYDKDSKDLVEFLLSRQRDDSTKKKMLRRLVYHFSLQKNSLCRGIAVYASYQKVG